MATVAVKGLNEIIALFNCAANSTSSKAIWFDLIENTVKSTISCKVACLLVENTWDSFKLCWCCSWWPRGGSTGHVLVLVLVAQSNEQLIDESRCCTSLLGHHVASHICIKRDLEWAKRRLNTTEVVELCFWRPNHKTTQHQWLNWQQLNHVMWHVLFPHMLVICVTVTW